MCGIQFGQVDAKKAKKNAERAALARGEKLEPDTKKVTQSNGNSVLTFVDRMLQLV